MEGVEGLYKKFGVLADAKDKAGEYESEYLSILSTISNGSDAEKRLCASFIPRFFKSFPDHQDTAFNAQLDLCEEEEAVIRREAIKGLPDLCKADNKLIARMSSVLAQLLPIDGHLDQTIVKHCLVQLLKQDAKAAIAGIVNQVMTGKEDVQEAARKFLLERLDDHEKYLPTLQSDEETKEYLIEQIELIGLSGTYDEFRELMQLAAGLDRRKTLKIIAKEIDMEKPFDPSNTVHMEQLSMLLPVMLKHHKKDNTSHIIKYYGTVLPLFSQIAEPKHKLMMLQGLAETLHASVTEEDAALCLDGIYSLLLHYLPEEVPTTDIVQEPPSLNFSMLECLLYSLHKAAHQVPSFLKDESRMAEITPKLKFVLRCCACYSKRLKSSAIGEDTPEKVKLKTKAYKTCNNTKELLKGLTSVPITYKSDIGFSWRLDLVTVTNRLFSPLASDKRPSSKPPVSPTAKRRRGSDTAPGRRAQQVYAPPKGHYSGNIGVSNGQGLKRDSKEEGKLRSERSERRRF